jgi:vacuolar-type H+-ATPase subunit H
VAKQGSEDLVAQISERVREALAEAEKRAEHIVAEAERHAQDAVAEAEARARELVAEAEREAKRIRTETEEEARERVERARAALDELGEALNPTSRTSRAEAPVPPPEEAPAEAMPEPVAAEPEAAPEEPEPEVAEPEPQGEVPEPEPDPESPEPSSDGPSTEELIAQLRGGEPAPATEPADRADKGDSGAARLVAMNMALEGASRDEIERHLAEGYDVADSKALIDEVLSRVSR